MPSKPTPEETLDAILSRVPRLRAAGVTELTVGGVSVKLGASVPDEPDTASDTASPPLTPDPLNDSETYGGAPGSPAPGLKHRQRANG